MLKDRTKLPKSQPEDSFRYLLACGSNLGDRVHNCDVGEALLVEQEVRIVRRSPAKQTKPLLSEQYATDDHAYYLNILLEVQSNLAPDSLYKTIRAIEDQVGHNRKRRWAPRQLDIDILLGVHDDDQIFEHCQPLFQQEGTQGKNIYEISLPHYAVWERPFIKELAEQMRYNWSLLELTHAKSHLSLMNQSNNSIDTGNKAPVGCVNDMGISSSH